MAKEPHPSFPSTKAARREQLNALSQGFETWVSEARIETNTRGHTFVVATCWTKVLPKVCCHTSPHVLALWVPAHSLTWTQSHLLVLRPLPYPWHPGHHSNRFLFALVGSISIAFNEEPQRQRFGLSLGDDNNSEPRGQINSCRCPQHHGPGEPRDRVITAPCFQRPGHIPEFTIHILLPIYISYILPHTSKSQNFTI